MNSACPRSLRLGAERSLVQIQSPRSQVTCNPFFVSMGARVGPMGGSARRFGCLCLLVLGAVGLLSVSAGAVTLGSRQIDQTLTDFGLGATAPPLCVYVQKRLPGLPVRAPFSGRVRTWRVVSPGNWTTTSSS